MSKNVSVAVADARELAFLYDLYVVPGWREVFDQIVDQQIKAPEAGRFLDVECGTGGYAIDMALNGGRKVEVVGVDSSPERLALARDKALVKKVERIEFKLSEATNLEFTDNSFDFVIADLSLLPVRSVSAACDEIVRVAKKGAPVVIKISTRGSFDEFFSLYWEALYELDLITCTPQLEALITERLTVANAEQMADDAGLLQIRSETHHETFEYQNAKAFVEAPLISAHFWNRWISIIPDPKNREKVKKTLLKIIDRERHDIDFYFSVKATVIMGKK